MTRSRVSPCHLAGKWLGLVLLAAGCGAPGPRVESPGQEGTPFAPTATPAQAPSAPTEPPACTLTATKVRLRIDEGQEMHTGTGLTVRHEGTSHDNFGPEGFDFVVALHFSQAGKEARHAHSFRDRIPHAVLGHCYRIVDAAAGAVLIELSSLPDPNGQAGTSDLVGAGGPPAPNAVRCTRVRKGGPGSEGPEETRGCGPDEICLCEAQAGYSCQGRCIPATSGYPERSPDDPLQ